jgi:hypothetical protein
MRWAGAALGLVLLIMVGGVTVEQAWIRVPPNWLPWGRPNLNAPPSWFARIQINALATDGAACIDVLNQSDIRFSSIPDRRVDGDCGFENAVRATHTPVPIEPGVTATCSLMAALDWYEHVLQPAAGRDLGSRLTGIDQLGTYACRNINSEKTGPRSEHTTANAIDIAAFRFADDRTISVAADWIKQTPTGRFLKDAHVAACGLFNVVLGPDYNRLHANHFHLDLGRFRMCR